MGLMDSITRALAPKRAAAKEEEMRENLKRDATLRSIKDYNITRIDGVDYITHLGVPVSVPEDSSTSSMCDRLEVYRSNYVNACMATGRLLCL